MNLTVEHIWWIPAAPLLAAGIGMLAPGRRGLAAGAAIVAMGVALVLAVLALAGVARGGVSVSNFTWFEVGGRALELGWMLDPLAGFMLVMVSFVGLLIFIFSLGYMHEDPNAGRFFVFLSFFAAAMLGVLIANSLLLLFICWELVGLASYLLIGFWFHKPEAAAAARKAFLVTRIGDLGLFVGMLWLADTSGTLLFHNAGQGILEEGVLSGIVGAAAVGGIPFATAIGLLLFCGAAGKSGQVPLHVWLPDAMEGPTPVSALIHAATMVAAGVLLMARVYPLMEADQAIAGSVHALTVVAFVGAITALVGAAIAVAQNDIKRVLAYSTVSQLGYMMLAVGTGAWVAAVFHLLTHAFFKALLFLGAGSVIHAAGHEQDLRRLGGLRTRMPLTFATFVVGALALAGAPFLFSGFWSKEAILHAAGEWEVSHFPLWAALAGIVLTAFYMTRLIALAFFGTPRSAAAAGAHESPRVMTLPLALLAVCAIAVGFVGTPAWPWLLEKLTGETIERHGLVSGGALLAASIGLVGLGLAAGWWIYGRAPRASAGERDRMGRLFPRIYGALEHRLGFDPLYAATVVRWNSAAAGSAAFLDRMLWTGATQLLAAVSWLAGLVARDADEGALNAGFDRASGGVRGAGVRYSRAQTGHPQGYLRGIAMGFVILALLVVLGGAQ